MMKKEVNKGGRPPLSSAKKRDKRICIYLTNKEYQRYESLKSSLSSSSPPLSASDFFRLILQNQDLSIFDYLGISFDDPLVSSMLKSKRVYKKIY